MNHHTGPTFDTASRMSTPRNGKIGGGFALSLGDPMMYLTALLTSALGVAAIVLGEADDSPGLQLIGVLLVVGAVALGIKTAQRRRSHLQQPLSRE